MAVSLEAPAKVNLTLRVVGRRPDGYHELETLFHAIDLCDELVCERTVAKGVSLEIVGRADGGLPVAAGEDNLVVRAARAYVDRVLPEFGLHFRLTKRIPAGGGLGGGSSNAAAAIRLADELCDHALEPAQLHRIAASLGADVPFFLHGRTQLGTGTGTDLRPWPNPPKLHFLLLLPAFGTSTPEVYKNYRPQWFDDGPTSRIRSIEAAVSQGISLASILANDLEPAAESAYPALRRLRSRVAEAGFPEVRLSGSGSSMFLAFEREEDVSRAAGALHGLANAERISVLAVRSAEAKHIHHLPWSDDTPGRVNRWG
ncbi:MAG: 4-(cytidine 5'-diphospho)-2-C-methyl-D-erythritol kinase [Planctomycetes bacterium]|nr:4-(cytidine 5'-diphospho)-2-C-methyl-D-erythritol kinase [Planctomycetota bacterium]